MKLFVPFWLTYGTKWRSRVNQASKMKHFAKLVNGFKPLTIFENLSISDAWLTRKSIEGYYDTGNINRYQLTKSYKMAVSFVLDNILTFTHWILFLLWHLFRRLFFLYLKTLLLRTNLCWNCYVTHHVSLNLFQLKGILLCFM